MIDQYTDFFEYVDNFAKTAHIPSIPIFESNLEYIPEITIAIPTYKRADLLKEAIDSAINQIEYTNYDIIVVDNNPERGCETEKLMMSYNNPMLSYYKNSENIGMAGNWNRLFTLAKGKYVVILHDDDLLLPTFISECINIAYMKNADLIKPLAFNIDKNDNYSDLHDDIKGYRIKRVFDISNSHGNALGAPTGCLIKRESLIKLGGFNQNYYPTHDFCFLVYFAKYFRSFRVYKKLYIYRKQFSTSSDKKVLDGFINNDFYLYTQLLKNYRIHIVLIRKYLSYRFYQTIKSNRINWNMPDYSFDITKLGLRPNDKGLGNIVSKLLRLYVMLIVFYLKIFHNKL